MVWNTSSFHTVPAGLARAEIAKPRAGLIPFVNRQTITDREPPARFIHVTRFFHALHQWKRTMILVYSFVCYAKD